MSNEKPTAFAESVVEMPILFKKKMVEAILDGRKTATRRIIKPAPTSILKGDVFKETRCPYGEVGNGLWVREKFLYRQNKTAVIYEAGHSSQEAAGLAGMYGGWKPSIHMPRWACRLTMQILAIRVERLQYMSEEEAWAEGCEPGAMMMSAVDNFELLWKSINGEESWDTNPFVWVVDFKRVANRCG